MDGAEGKRNGWLIALAVAVVGGVLSIIISGWVPGWLKGEDPPPTTTTIADVTVPDTSDPAPEPRPTSPTSTAATTTTTAAPTTTAPPPPPAPEYLADLPGPYLSNDDVDTASVAGQDYEKSIRAIACYGTNSDPTEFSFQLDGDYSKFTAVLGMTDNTNDDWKVRITILVDNVPVKTSDVQFLSGAESIDIPLTGKVRLTLRYVTLKGGGGCRLGVFSGPVVAGGLVYPAA